MNVEEIVFGDRFLKYFEKLTTKVKQQFFLKLELFEQNPFHPSLRLHKLT